jgi:broad specificity phosphatase PhoE
MPVRPQKSVTLVLGGVTHAGVIRLTLGKALGPPARNWFRLAQDSCALNIIDYREDDAIVRCMNG